MLKIDYSNIKAAIRFIGLNPRHYKGHSFHIGAATHASNFGYSENAIQVMGRWHSNAVRRYIRLQAFKEDGYPDDYYDLYERS